MTKLRTLLAALIVAQFACYGSAQATPACQSNNAEPSNCQWRYTNTGTTLGGGDSGTFNSTPASTAPAPGTSKGIRQDKGITNILYDNYANACRFVDNTSRNDLFVPQNTENEFAAFVNSSLTLGLGYCTLGEPYSHTATATYPSGYEIFGNGAAANLTIPAGAVASTVLSRWGLPTTRVPYPSPQYTMTLTYGREDCRVDEANATVCRARIITETQVFQVVNVPNQAQNCQNFLVSGIVCDGNWGGVVMVPGYPTFMVDGNNGPYSDGLEDYDPPGLESCDSGEYANGATWTQTTSGTPTSQACPTGDTGGPLSCATTAVANYSCADGEVVAGTVTTTPTTNCTGTCTAPAAPVTCDSTVIGNTCGTGNQAQAFLYQLPVGSNTAPVAFTELASGASLLTAEDRIADLVFFTNTIDVTLQNWTTGFPGYPQLTQWFGVCYDGGFQAPTTGSYIFAASADVGASLFIDGTDVLDNTASGPDLENMTCQNTAQGVCTVYPIAYSQPVTLTAGLHDVELEYWNEWAGLSGTGTNWVNQIGIELYVAQSSDPSIENLQLAGTDPNTPMLDWAQNGNYQGVPSPASVLAPFAVMPLVGPPSGVINCPH